MRDNQGRDLEATKKWKALEKTHHSAGTVRMLKSMENTVYPEWTEVDGVKALRIEDSKFVAVPNRSKMDIIDLETRTLICQVKKTDACKWLINATN